jgi:hypothetical protein
MIPIFISHKIISNMNATEHEITSIMENKEQPAIIMVYSGTCEEMVSRWDSFVNHTPTQMFKVHLRDIPVLSILYGIHYLPSFVSNQGHSVQYGYKNKESLGVMISSVTNNKVPKQ